MFFCTPPTSEDRHLCCLYEHCGHNDFYFVRYWYSSVITNVLRWDINTPSRFHLPHLMLLRLDSVAKWFPLMVSFLLFIEISSPTVSFSMQRRRLQCVAKQVYMCLRSGWLSLLMKRCQSLYLCLRRFSCSWGTVAELWKNYCLWFRFFFLKLLKAAELVGGWQTGWHHITVALCSVVLDKCASQVFVLVFFFTAERM